MICFKTILLCRNCFVLEYLSLRVYGLVTNGGINKYAFSLNILD